MKFLPFGAGVLRGRLCPRCYSLPRHRLAWLYFGRRTNLFTDPLDVLHVAPEYTLANRLRALANLNYLSIDLNSPRAMRAMDLTALELDDASFDVILCSHVLEHIPDDRRAMRELHRVLRPGGWAILQVPIDPERAVTYEDASITDPESRLEHFGQEDHVRVYGSDYTDRLREAGFTVDEVDFAATLDPAECRRMDVRATETIFRCTK